MTLPVTTQGWFRQRAPLHCQFQHVLPVLLWIILASKPHQPSWMFLILGLLESATQ